MIIFQGVPSVESPKTSVEFASQVQNCTLIWLIVGLEPGGLEGIPLSEKSLKHKGILEIQTTGPQKQLVELRSFLRLLAVVGQ